MLVGLTAGSIVVLGIACWHLARGRNQELFRRAAKLALIVAVPVSAANLLVGSHFGIYTTERQPMKIASTEAQWNTCQPCGFSLFQIGGFTTSDQTPSFSIEIPRVLSFLATGSFNGQVEGINQVQKDEERAYGRGNYMPSIETVYWSMRIMAYLGTLVFLVSALGAFLYRKGRLERTRWYLWTAVGTTALPFAAALAGWVLTEVGRQPWIVQGLLKTSEATSPSVGAWTIGSSLAVFICLYIALAVVDFVLMRRYARLDPAAPADRPETLPLPVTTF
jgi:cytochrome d ubiquinol oxidase subunit I